MKGQIWTEMKTQLETLVPGPMFRTFIAPLKGEERGNDLVLSVPDKHPGAEHIRKHIRNFYAPRIEKLAKRKVVVEGA